MRRYPRETAWAEVRLAALRLAEMLQHARIARDLGSHVPPQPRPMSNRPSLALVCVASNSPPPPLGLPPGCRKTWLWHLACVRWSTEDTCVCTARHKQEPQTDPAFRVAPRMGKGLWALPPPPTSCFHPTDPHCVARAQVRRHLTDKHRPDISEPVSPLREAERRRMDGFGV